MAALARGAAAAADGDARAFQRHGRTDALNATDASAGDCVASGLHGLHAFERSKVLKPAPHMRACNQTHGVLAFLRDMHTSIAYILQ